VKMFPSRLSALVAIGILLASCGQANASPSVPEQAAEGEPIYLSII